MKHFEEPKLCMERFTVTETILFTSAISIVTDETNPYSVPAITQE